MNRIAGTVIPFLSFLMLVPNLGHADEKILLWNTAKGLIESDGCEQQETYNIPFRIANGQIALQPLRGGSFMTVPSRSLLRTIGDTSTNSKSELHVEVISAAQTPGKTPGKKSASAGQEGRVENRQLLDIDDYVFQVQHAIQLPDDSEKKTETYWQADMNKGKYKTLHCPNSNAANDFVVFDVFVKEKETPIAMVAVSSADASILANNQPLLTAEADNLLDFGQKPTTTAAHTSASTTTPTVTSEAVNHVEASAPPPKPAAPATVAASVTPSVPVINGSLEFAVCAEQSTIPVYGPDLKSVLFTAKKGDAIVPIQSFGDSDESASFAEVQFHGRAAPNVGWIAKDSVKAKSACSSLQAQQTPAPTEKSEPQSAEISGLHDSNCCVFPVLARPTDSYRTAQRRFGANRAGGRLHAACDIYRQRGDSVIAVAPGSVIRGEYYFYQGVYAIEVRHTGGFVVRYGEILGNTPHGSNQGSKVSAGQVVGYVGKVDSGCCSPMLHFELYSGAVSGSLTQPERGGYQRRSDLLNPTSYLSEWEKAKFGTSY